MHHRCNAKDQRDEKKLKERTKNSEKKYKKGTPTLSFTDTHISLLCGCCLVIRINTSLNIFSFFISRSLSFQDLSFRGLKSEV